jgi:hypothetical protein
MDSEEAECTNASRLKSAAVSPRPSFKKCRRKIGIGVLIGYMTARRTE